jgi:hypothetical protein
MQRTVIWSASSSRRTRTAAPTPGAAIPTGAGASARGRPRRARRRDATFSGRQAQLRRLQRGGFDQAESTRVVEALDAEAIDLLGSRAAHESAVMFRRPNPHTSSRKREAFFLEYAERPRAHANAVDADGWVPHVPEWNAALESGAIDRSGWRVRWRSSLLAAGLLDGTPKPRDRCARHRHQARALCRRFLSGTDPPARLGRDRSRISRWRVAYEYVVGARVRRPISPQSRGSAQRVCILRRMTAS